MELIIGTCICILAIAVSYGLGEYFQRKRENKEHEEYTYHVDGEKDSLGEEQIQHYIQLAAGYMRRRHQIYGLDKGYYQRAAEQLVIYIVERQGHLPTSDLVQKIEKDTEEYFKNFREMEDVLKEKS